jgi:CubicO group peptidase (beta-lactamase class C family)
MTHRSRRSTCCRQTSGWDGELWGKPAAVDQQSRGNDGGPVGGPPGSVWAYNDVRVNLLCLALTAACGQSLETILAEAVMRPIGGQIHVHGTATTTPTSTPAGRGFPWSAAEPTGAAGYGCPRAISR